MHVHLLVNDPPKVPVSKFVNALKGVSSRLIRKSGYLSITKALWDKSCFAGGCGGASIEAIREYIEQQQSPPN